jgi:hypothetical protein
MKSVVKKSNNNKTEIYGDFTIKDTLEGNTGTNILDSIATPSYLTDKFTLTSVSITFVCSVISGSPTSSTQTLRFYKYGNTVFIYIPSFTITTGTSTAGITCAVGSIPSSLCPPTAAERTIYNYISASTYGTAVLLVNVDGSLYFSANYTNNGRFNTTTTVGVPYPFMFSYVI